MRIRNGIALIAIGLAGVGLVACDEGDTYLNTPGAGGTDTGIHVTGSGEAFGTPDVALISLGIQAEATTVAAAREAAASRAQAVIEAVKKNGVADKDIQTTQYSIQPQYDYNRTNGTQTIRGYKIINVLSVKVRKIDSTSKVLDDATAAGGNNTLVQGISFTIDDPTKLQEEARTKAVDAAKKVAEQLAKDAGVKLGKPISITESSGYSPVYAEAGLARSAAADTATPIETGELQVNISVTIMYSFE